MLARGGGTRVVFLPPVSSMSLSFEGTRTVASMLLTALTNLSMALMIDCWEQENISDPDFVTLEDVVIADGDPDGEPVTDERPVMKTIFRLFLN